MRYFLAIVFLITCSGAISQSTGSSFISKAKYTNKQVVWYEYDYWLDGSKLSDAKNKNNFNDVLFKKVGNKYYKAQVEGAYNVEDWGIKKDFEGGKPEENSRLIQAMIDYFPAGHTASIYIPTGTYQFARAILVDSRPVHLYGDNGSIFTPYATKLLFPAGVNGIAVRRTVNSYQDAIIERLCIIGQPNSSTWASGITSWARITIRDCTVKGFSHNGIDFWANLEEPGNVGDASGSLVERCHSLENVHDGFFAGRTDANAITFIANDARDNGRYGFNDDSFLGNNFISCMAHYNKAGDYYVRDKGNAKSLFQACYSEGGNKISELSGKSTVLGGIWGTGYTKDGGKSVLY
jgi:hypothetical protein